MAIDNVLFPLFETTSIVILKPTSAHTDGYTKRGYQTTSNGRTVRGHIERSEDTVRGEDGRTFVSRRKVFLFSSTGWTSTSIPRTTDRLVLPATHGPDITPQIMMSQVVSDDRGIHHIVIYF